jgi:pullulanase
MHSSITTSPTKRPATSPVPSVGPYRAFLLCALAALAAFAGLAAPTAVGRSAAPVVVADGTRLVVHYHRPGGDYDGWNLWVWPEGGEGKAYPFDGVDAFGRFATVPFAAAPKRVGFIVRRGAWEEKDVDQDRFIDLAAGGTTSIWLLSGDPAIRRAADEVDTSLRIGTPFLDADDRIVFGASAPLDAALRDAIVVAVRDPGGSKKEERRIRVRSVADLGRSGGMAMHAIELAAKVPPRDVARLELRFEPRGAAAREELPEPRTVFARDVLSGPAFVDEDARLGAFASKTSTRFATWSPVSESVELLLFDALDAAEPSRVVQLERKPKGVWSIGVDGDLHGVAYAYRFDRYGTKVVVPDMHAFAATADSRRSVVVDLARLEPEGFRTSKQPKLAQPTDEVIYEIHVRDYSIRDERCPPELRGTYRGLVHRAEATETMPSSGVSHLLDLGVTAVHLLPIHDFTAGIDEYNWGYWTTLFNVPETNYASVKSDPTSAIVDLRTAIRDLHAAGIRVILDVVYNHTSSTADDSPFGGAVPYYFFRTTPDGRLMNDTGVGNTVADERPMMRKYILDSLRFWIEEYRVDGFRFDLLGTHEPETVRAIDRLLESLRSDLTVYGEPWTGGGRIRFGKGAQRGMELAVFNDHIRNAIRGDLDGTTAGFATGPGGDDAAIRRGIAGAIDDFTADPTETINYASAHDNLILWDKILKTRPEADEATRRAMQKLAHGVVLTSQGIPFVHGGCDFARTKFGNHNSYNAGDDVNAFDWPRKALYADVFSYIAGLIELRRAHPVFRLDDDDEVRRALSFFDDGPILGFVLDGTVAGDSWDRVLVAFNDEPNEDVLTLPPGRWTLVVDATRAGVEPLGTIEGEVRMPPYSMIVAHRPAR